MPFPPRFGFAPFIFSFEAVSSLLKSTGLNGRQRELLKVFFCASTALRSSWRLGFSVQRRVAGIVLEELLEPLKGRDGVMSCKDKREFATGVVFGKTEGRQICRLGFSGCFIEPMTGSAHESVFLGESGCFVELMTGNAPVR